MKITKEEIRDILMYVILIHECRDSATRDSILDTFEKKPYYEEVMKVFDETSCTYFKLGFDFSNFLASQATIFDSTANKDEKFQLTYNIYVITKETQIETVGDDQIKFSKFKEIERKPLATCTSENLDTLRLVGESHHERIIDLDNNTAWIRVVAWECIEPIGGEELLLAHYDQMALNQLDNEVVAINHLKQQHWHFD